MADKPHKTASTEPGGQDPEGEGGVLGTWFFQVRGQDCVEVGYEELRAWEQWRLRGSSHELCSSTQHTEEVKGGILASYGYERETVKDTLANLRQQLSRF